MGEYLGPLELHGTVSRRIIEGSIKARHSGSSLGLVIVKNLALLPEPSSSRTRLHLHGIEARFEVQSIEHILKEYNRVSIREDNEPADYLKEERITAFGILTGISLDEVRKMREGICVDFNRSLMSIIDFPARAEYYPAKLEVPMWEKNQDREEI
jgi:hypothetical protein